MDNSVNTSKNDSAIESKSNSSLPLARIRVIMKSLPDVQNITPEALLLVTRATEMFIKYLTDKSKKHITGKQFDYKHMAIAVDAEENLEFMTEIMPKKLTVKQVREHLQAGSDSEDGEEEEGEEEESGEEEEEEEDEEEKDEETASKSIKSGDESDCVVVGD